MPALATITMDVLAKRSGFDAQAILAYQRQGLLPKPQRVSGGLLLYRVEDVERLSFIRRALELGFSVDAVRELLGLASRKPKACADVHDIASRHLADVRRRIAELARLESMLAPLVESCTRSGGLDDCPILSSLAHPGPDGAVRQAAD
jgi:MerR family transcriptional regulator, mercuric resistance operon regulatory protein